jgi:hypothetical protein
MTTTLQMPQNYVEMTDEEMMYVDGGWSWSTAQRNVKAMLATPAAYYVGKILWNYMCGERGNARTYANMVWKTSVSAAKAFYLLPWQMKLLGLAAGAAFIYSIGTWSIF